MKKKETFGAAAPCRLAVHIGRHAFPLEFPCSLSSSVTNSTSIGDMRCSCVFDPVSLFFSFCVFWERKKGSLQP